MATQETDNQFSVRFGEALTDWVEVHTAPDKPKIDFIGGPKGRFRVSPRELASAVVEKTPLGIHHTQFALWASTRLGDPTGKKIIQIIRREIETAQEKTNGS